MTVVLKSDRFWELGEKYANDYFNIMEKEIPDAIEKDEGYAELLEKADRVQKLSQEAYNQAESMKALEGAKQDAIDNTKEENNPDDNEDYSNQKKEWDGFGSGAQFLKTVYNMKANNLITDDTSNLKWWDGDASDKALVQSISNRKALAESTGATGGFLVPAEFRARLMALMATQSIIQPRATVQRMNRRTLTIPVLNQEGAVSESASWFGGIRGYWKDEAAQFTETTPAFKDFTLTAHKHTALTYSSEEMLADSAVALEDYLLGDKGFTGYFAWKMDYVFFRGDGVGKPEGILESNCLISTGGATGNTSRAALNDITYEDLAAMLQRALPTANLIWVASQSTMAELLTMNGPSGNPSYLWGNATSGIPNTLLGRPIYFTDKLPALGSTGDILLVDPSYYIIGDRQALTIDMSTENRFEFEQATWRASIRLDGKMWLEAPITYAGDASQVSPAVALATFST